MDEMKIDMIKFNKDQSEVLYLGLKRWLQKFRKGGLQFTGRMWSFIWVVML